MAYDLALADRIRSAYGARAGLTEKAMFGGLAFLAHGNMCCGIVRDTLMLRLGEERATAALAEPHVREMDFAGKPMKPMVYVDPPGIDTDEALARWLELAWGFAVGLPAKEKGASRKPGRKRAIQTRQRDR